jgi:hypothetical protein
VFCQGSSRWPVSNRVENYFANAVGILLPASQLVRACKTDTFLEAPVTVRRPPECPTLRSSQLRCAERASEPQDQQASGV